jgi:hypothetical protein
MRSRKLNPSRQNRISRLSSSNRPSPALARKLSLLRNSRPNLFRSNRPSPSRLRRLRAKRSQPAVRVSVRTTTRIPQARFQANFGQGHNFRMGNPHMVGGYSRFSYGGFNFGFVEPWPVGWYYTDDVYIDYVDGEYFLFDPYYPGARVEISVVM